MSNEHYEIEITELLAELSEVQEELIALLSDKRAMLASQDAEGLGETQTRADVLVARLSACQERRQQLLVEANSAGHSVDSVMSLAASLGSETSGKLGPAFANARNQNRLLQHQSLANWVIVQRSLLHLSQMIEIFATGGRKRPTYEKGKTAVESGSFVDRAV